MMTTVQNQSLEHPCCSKSRLYLFYVYSILVSFLKSEFDLEISHTEDQLWYLTNRYTHTVKSRLSERQLSETIGLFEDDGQSLLFSLLPIAIKLPIIRISIIPKIQFYEVIRRSR